MLSTSRPQQSLFLEDWLRTAAADASQLQSPLPPPPPAAAILRSWAGLRDPSYDTPRILSALETLSRSRAALHVSDPQVKLLISLLSSPLLSAEAIPHLLCLLYVYLRKSPRPSTPIILSILSISSSFPPSPHSVLLLGALAASPALPDASRPSCLDRLCSFLDSSLPAILHDVSLLPEFLAGVGYALSRSEDNSYFGKILNFLFRVWDSRAGGIPPVLSHGLMLLYLFDWCASGFLASRSWNKIESLHHGISGDKCKSRGYSAPFVVLMTSAGILRAFNSNRVEIDPPLRKSIEVLIFYGAECAISMTESSSGTDGARDSHILLQCVALCLVRCGPISYYPPVLRCLCLALLNEIFPLQSVIAMSLENGKGNSITNTVKEHLGSAVFKEAGAVTRIFCNQYAAADEASKVMVENHLWDYSQELYSNVRIAAWVHRGKSNGILEDLEKIAEAAFLMVVVFAAEVTKKKLNKSSQEFKPEVSSRILVTFSCIEYLRRARLPEYTEAVRRAVLTIQEDAPSCALFIESMPPYAELTKAQGSIILERMRYIWSLDEVQTARVSFYLRVLPACISLIPTPVFREQVTPTMFLYLQHPNEKVTRASHSVFVSFVSSGNDSDLDDRLALKEQLVSYYMQRALEMYPDITSFEGLVSGVAALVRHLPAGSPVISYCIHSLVGEAADLCRKALSEDPTLWKNWEGNSGPPKKILDLLLRLIYLADIQGVLVRRVEPTSSASDVLKLGDVIVSFDGVQVGSEGTVPFRSTERIAFRYLISEKFAGDVAELGIIRDGIHMNVQTELQPRVYLVPFHIQGGQPSYLIIAGLVFTPLSEPLIEEECEDSIGLKLLAKARYSLARFKGEEIVILSQVLANEVNIGYEDMGNQQVMKFNGTPIKNIRHLAHLVDSCKDKYLIFEFEDNFLAVLEREAASAASPFILKDYGIPCERSSDLLEPYIDLEEDGKTPNQDIGESPVSNDELGFDGLIWA